MPSQRPLSRSEFLRLSAITAAGTLVAACASGGATTAGGGSSATGTAAAPASSSAAATSSTVPATSAAASAASATVATSSTAGLAASSAGSATPAASTTTGAGTSSAAGSVTAAAGSSSLAAGNVATPVAFQGTLHEAPTLAAMVKAGSLPPVEQRLPAQPYVVPHPWLSAGKYGGTMQWAVSSGDDSGTTQDVAESMYGHSPLRYLRDGLAIGPGLAESWESNADASTWTLHFRKGLRWSDGQPWSVDDILFWWQDEVQVPDLKEYPPDAFRSSKGTLATLKKLDDVTLQIDYDAPQPLLPAHMASYVKRGQGPRLMDPMHYLKQFHIKYNPKVDKTKWVETFLAMRKFETNPQSPTLTGWMLKQYNKGQNSVWVRNPYYYCVDKAGNQLPYVDGLTMTNVQDPEVLKLRFTTGKVDYGHGGFLPFSLADVATFKQSQAQSGMQLWFWDSGSGTASMYFFNYDFAEPKMRALIRNPKFRQALSHAYNRDRVRKAVYFEQGDPTTGTLSPKAIEYHLGQGPQVFQQWRDSYVSYDPERAKQMLDAIGVKMNGQYRTMPDGSPLTITLDYPADQPSSGEHVKKNELLASDWQAIGLNAKLNPVTPTGYDDQWAAGKLLMKTAWEVGNGPDHLVNATWLLPLERARWAPLEGTYYTVRGTPEEHQQQDVDPYKRTPPRMAPEPGGPIAKMWQLYDQAKAEPDLMKRTQLVWDIIKIHVSDGPFFSGTVANYPQMELVKTGLKNVPTRDDLGPQNGYQHGFVNPWQHPTPAVYDPETYYWDDPSQHQ